MEFIKGEWKVVYENIGEGKFGDYDPTDNEDENLLRASLYTTNPKYWDDPTAVDEWGWGYPADSSYCTLAPVDTPREKLEHAAFLLIEKLEYVLGYGGSVKKTMERWSWHEYA